MSPTSNIVGITEPPGRDVHNEPRVGHAYSSSTEGGVRGRMVAERLMASGVDVLCSARLRRGRPGGRMNEPRGLDGCTFVARLVMGARHACEGGYVHGGQGH